MTDIIHKSNFRPQARILELLGDQLIKNHRLALFELVKNAYDADSPSVTVNFENILDRGRSTIEIRDSGTGMSLDRIKNVWLEPASNHQAIKRKKEERTPKFHRLPLGEKGVGRFAVQKLGNIITLITREIGGSEIQLEFDWRTLDKHKYLADVPIVVKEVEPTQFTGQQHGTFIRISDLKQVWTRGDIRRLYRSVTSMVSPFRNKDEFKVEFKVSPEQGWLDNLFSAEDSEQFALYHFDFLLDDEGFQWEYSFAPYESMMADYKDEIVPRRVGKQSHPGFEFFTLCAPSSQNASWKSRDKRADKVSLSALGIGPIYGRIVAFDLDPEIKARYINDTSGLTGFLKEQGGMRVYRDGMRVYDYGEPGNDWLGIDMRRVQRPVSRLSNNLFFGELLLDLSSSQKLQEKTNREGFVENEAFNEFHYAVLCALSVFEAERQKDKRIIRDCFKLTKEERQTHFRGPEEAINQLRKKIIKEKLTDKLGSYVDRVEKTYNEARDVLMSAVGSGMGLSMVFHEMERGVRGIHQALMNERPLGTIMEMSTHLVDLLKGAAFLVKSSKSESFAASTLVNNAVFTLQPRFEYHNIRFINGFDGLPVKNFNINGSRRMLLAALANLIDNAIHWVKVSRETDDKDDAVIWVGPSNDLEAPAILVADSGPGFMDPPEDVIGPFFTRKLEGMGLGLYYADMALKANKGRLAFPENSDVDIPKKCTGGVVAMVFPERNK